MAELAEKFEKLQRRYEREKSARKQAERIAEDGMRELFLANRSLDAKVSERTAELEAARDRSNAAAESRLRFLAALTRQVRTPLNGVSGMLELLSSQDLDEQSLVWLSSASQSAKDLLHLFARLTLFLELNEIDHPTLAKVSVAELADHISNKWGEKSLGAGKLLSVSNETALSSEILGDRTRLCQLMDEVVENAVLHANPGSIQVKFETISNRLVISVIDSGPGITNDNERYGSVSAETDFEQSLGMGYSLIAKLASILSVDVRQSSEDGRVVMSMAVPELSEDRIAKCEVEHVRE